MQSHKIVCIGDSITYGYEIPEGQKWITLLSEALSIEIINCGINGDTTAGMLSRFEQILIKHNPTQVIITGGTNDLWFGLKDELIISNIHAMARLARHNNIESIIGITTPFFNLNELNFVQENFSECIRSFKSILVDYCNQKELPFIDFSSNLNQSHFMDDGLHPNTEGQKIMSENAKHVLIQLLNLNGL